MSVNKTPVCPYCGTKQMDWGVAFDPKYDGDSWGTSCDECGRDYEVTMHVSTSFESRPEKAANNKEKE